MGTNAPAQRLFSYDIHQVFQYIEHNRQRLSNDLAAKVPQMETTVPTSIEVREFVQNLDHPAANHHRELLRACRTLRVIYRCCMFTCLGIIILCIVLLILFLIYYYFFM